MLRSSRKYLALVAIVIYGCSDAELEENLSPNDYSEPVIIDYDLNSVHDVNLVNGDSTDGLMTQMGFEFDGAERYELPVTEIDLDTMPESAVIDLKSERLIPADPNVTKAEFSYADLDPSLLVHGKLGESDVDYTLVNTLGDTLKTGVWNEVAPDTMDVMFPKRLDLKKPQFKESSLRNVRTLGPDQGLPSPIVTTIHEDARGDIWIATSGAGLIRYNGENCYQYNSEVGFANDVVFEIFEDSKGNMWFGTLGGTVKYDGHEFVGLATQHGLGHPKTISIDEDSEGNIWLGTMNGLAKYDGARLIVYTSAEGLGGNNIWCSFQDSKGRLWVSTVEGSLVCIEGEKITRYDNQPFIKDNIVLRIKEDKEQNLWFGTRFNGLVKFDGKRFSALKPNNMLNDNSITGLLLNDDGSFWLGTQFDGLKYLEGDNLYSYSEDNDLSGTMVYSLSSDSDGGIWVGTWGSGLSYLEPNSFEHRNIGSGLPDDNIWSLAEDKQGNIWFGTYSQGLCKNDGESITQYTTEEGMAGMTFMALTVDDSNVVWAGTNNAGINLIDEGRMTHFSLEQGLPSEYVLNFFKDSRGRIWIGMEKGICCYDHGKLILFESDEMIHRGFNAITEDKNGAIWAGTWGSGISVIETVDDKFYVTHLSEKQGLSDNSIFALFKDSKENIWIGTYQAGIQKFDGNKFYSYSTDNGVSSNFITSFIEDENGYIWASSFVGTNLFVETDEPNIYNIVQFDTEDGLKGISFNVQCALRSSKDELWWGTLTSLTTIKPDSGVYSKDSPDIRIESISIKDETFDFHRLEPNDSLGFDFDDAVPYRNVPNGLNLDYSQNHLTFYFAAIDWKALNDIRYSYRLKGLETKWSTPTTELKADYRNIPHGDYAFQVKAIGESAIWSDPYELKFTVNPPWWHTTWARILYAVLGILVLILWGRLRTAQLKRKQILLEGQIEEATAEIREQKEEVELQKQIIEESHREIKDSIAYAKRIQSAILPPPKLVKEYLKDSFILYKPKDVVAGDFYWMANSGNKVLFAAADCTGHGVPGAMVSVICNGGLNRSVNEFGLTDPGKILDKTRELVIAEFEKSEEEVKDGMDIALCSMEGNKIEFAGAHNPLWIIRKGATEVEQIKADKQPIGKYSEETPFTTSTVELNEGDTFYLFSDGYADQFGGDKGKKLKSANFKKLLLSLQDLSMDEQVKKIDEAFEEWRGGLEQVDDVCVIGVRI